jgi:hypothetical protein
MQHILDTRFFSATEATAARIFNLAQVRELELRDGKYLQLEENWPTPLTTFQKCHVESSFAYTRGEEPDKPCTQCTQRKPVGPFKRCIILHGEFGSACCNCRYTYKGRKKCQFYRQSGAPSGNGIDSA